MQGRWSRAPSWPGSACSRKYLEEQGEIGVPSLYGGYFLLKLVQLELVELALEQREIDLTLGGSYLDLKDTNSCWLDGFVLAFLERLIVAVDDLEVVWVAHVMGEG